MAMGGELEWSFILAGGMKHAVGRFRPENFQEEIAKRVMQQIRKAHKHIGDYYENGSHRYLDRDTHTGAVFLETSPSPANNGREASILLEAETQVVIDACAVVSQEMTAEYGRLINIQPTNVGSDPLGHSRAFHLNFSLKVDEDRVHAYLERLAPIAMLGAYLFSPGKVVPNVEPWNVGDLRDLTGYSLARTAKGYWREKPPPPPVDLDNIFDIPEWDETRIPRRIRNLESVPGWDFLLAPRAVQNDGSAPRRAEFRWMDRGFSPIMTAWQFDWLQMMIDFVQAMEIRGDSDKLMTLGVGEFGTPHIWHDTLSTRRNKLSMRRHGSYGKQDMTFLEFSAALRDQIVGSYGNPHPPVIEMDLGRTATDNFLWQLTEAIRKGKEAGFTNFGSKQHALAQQLSDGIPAGVSPYAAACQLEARLHIATDLESLRTRNDQKLKGIRARHGEFDRDEVKQYKESPMRMSQSETVGRLVRKFEAQARTDLITVNPRWFSVKTSGARSVFFDISLGIDNEMMNVMEAAVAHRGKAMPAKVTDYVKAYHWAFFDRKTADNNPERSRRSASSGRTQELSSLVERLDRE